MMRYLKRFSAFDFRDALILTAAVALVVGLALIYLPAALIIPASLLLALGYLRKWY